MSIKETIILAPRANKAELLKSLALYGKGSFGIRVFSSAYSLAEEMLLRKGIVETDVFPFAEAGFLINSVIRKVDAFRHASFTDSVNMASSLDTLRNLITDDEESAFAKLINDSSFSQKNKSFLEVYELYREALKGKKDRIDVIREALALEYDVDADFVSLEEFPLTPLEQHLLDRVSGAKSKTLELTELFEKEKKRFDNIHYIKAYGNSNEVENTLDYIFRNSIPLDRCVIALADYAKYGQLIYEYSQKYALDVSFAQGISISNSNPARLLKLYHQWDRSGYHGADSLMKMLYSSSCNLDKLVGKIGKEVDYSTLKHSINRAGQLKLDGDRKNNIRKVAEFIAVMTRDDRADRDVLMILAEELGQDVCTFLEKYSITGDRRDEEALRIIANSIRMHLHYRPNGHYGEIIGNILSANIGKSASREAALTVTDLKGAFSVCREHLFILGLSAGNFPGTVRENYLLLDDDVALFSVNGPTSIKMLERKKIELFKLLSLYSSLDAEIRLSYSCYDMTGLKTENASSVLFEIYKLQHVNASIREYEEELEENETEYFSNQLSVSGEIGRATVEGKQLSPLPQADIFAAAFDGKRVFSPSALRNYFSCPKRFYLSSIMGVEEPDSENPLAVIDGRELGNLVHSVMEYKANKDLSEIDFMDYGSRLFDDFLKGKNGPGKEAVESAKEEYRNIIRNGYISDPSNEVMAAEDRISVKHAASGISIVGYPDRVEKDKDGQYLIADYKTKKRVDSTTDDADSFLQVFLYGYMISHKDVNPLPITSCEYRYLRYGASVMHPYNREVEIMLENRLLQLKESLDAGVYPCINDDNICKHCGYATICGKETDSSEDEDDK